MLQAEALQVILGDTPIIHRADLSIPAARWTSIVGPNGAGKSTLLKALRRESQTAGLRYSPGERA